MKDEEKYLEDEMEKFGERWPYPASFDGYDKDWVDELTEECAKHFYELGKKDMEEQMMEGAEECELYWDGDFLAIDLNMQVLGYSERDKVKIIVVKEEKQ